MMVGFSDMARVPGPGIFPPDTPGSERECTEPKSGGDARARAAKNDRRPRGRRGVAEAETAGGLGSGHVDALAALHALRRRPLGFVARRLESTRRYGYPNLS